MRLSTRKFARLARVWDYLMTPRPAKTAARPLGLEALEAREVLSVTYNPAADFSAASPTSGPWQYGSAPTLAGAFALGTAQPIASEVDTWGAPGLPGVFHNRSSSPIHFANTVSLAGGEIGMHPGAGGEYAVVRFTAPATADYAINAAFAGRDDNFGGTDAHVLVSGRELFAAEVGSGGAGMAQPQTVRLAAGQTVDFRVGYGANHTYYGDSTNLTGTVTQLDGPYPQPSPGDAADNFSLTSPTYGAWSFGSEPKDGGTFAPGSQFDLTGGVAGWGAATWDNLPGAFKNFTAQSQHFRNTVTLGGGELALHPGVNGEWGVARFVAPAAGIYQITASFAGRDSSFGETDAHVLVDGEEIYAGAVIDDSPVGMAAPVTRYLAAGSVVDFAVGYGANGTYYNDSTALTASVTEVNYPAPPTVDFSSASYSVDEAESGRVVTVRLSHPTAQTVTVNYSTADGTATAPGDYAAASGVLSFAPGVTVQTFTVSNGPNPVSGDEDPETVELALTAPNNATLGVSAATLTIFDSLYAVDDKVKVNNTSRGGDRVVAGKDPRAAVLAGEVRFTSIEGTKEIEIEVAEDQTGPVTVRVRRTAGTSGSATLKYGTAAAADEVTLPKDKGKYKVIITGEFGSSEARNMRIEVRTGNVVRDQWDFTVFYVREMRAFYKADQGIVDNVPGTVQLSAPSGAKMVDAIKAISDGQTLGVHAGTYPDPKNPNNLVSAIYGTIVYRAQVGPIGIDPADFNQSGRGTGFDWKRTVTERAYRNGLLYNDQGFSGSLVANAQDDDVDDQDEDLTPGKDFAGDAALYIWVFDSPRYLRPVNDPAWKAGDTMSLRAQFNESLQYGGQLLTTDVLWSFRASGKWDAGKFGLDNQYG